MKIKTRSKLVALALAFSMTFPMMSYAVPQSNENGNGSEISVQASNKYDIIKFNTKKVMKHVEYLSETIGPRVAGTDEELQSAQYIKQQFEKLGYKTEMQEFDIHNVIASLNVDGIDSLIRVNTAGNSGYTSSQGITTSIVDCGLGNKPEDFPAEVNGNIALVQRGVESFELKTRNAVDAGAVAVIIYNNVAGSLNPSLGEFKPQQPVLAMTLDNGNLIKAELSKGEVKATLKAELKTKSQNVVATKSPKKNVKNPEIVYVTGHYDTVPHAPGANDNASGTAMMLELARVLKSVDVDKEIRFVACGAEEIGLVGSTYYVKQLSEEDINNSIANFNMDMIATSADECDILTINTVSGESNYATDEVAKACKALGFDSYRVAKGSSSDHAPFGKAGISESAFIWTNESGGLEKYYHTPDDTIAMNFSEERLNKAGDIVGTALLNVVKKETPKKEKDKVKSNKSLEKSDLGEKK